MHTAHNHAGFISVPSEQSGIVDALQNSGEKKHRFGIFAVRHIFIHVFIAISLVD